MAQNEVDIVIRAVDEASRQLDAVRKQMDRLQGSTDRASGAAKRLRRAYQDAIGPSKAVMGAVAAVGTAALGTAGYMVRLAGQMEQTEIAFGTMLGSAEAASDFLDELADTAGRTPFNLTGLQQASRLLLAFGFQAEDAIPVVTTLGDAVSALGGGDAELQGVIRAVGQIQAKGKVSAEELMQLAERGIPAYQILQDELGLTGDQVANIGNEGISAADGINALLRGISERFGGAMQQQSQTLLGMLSNVQDEATRIAIEVGQQIVDGLNLKPAMDAAITTLGNLRTRIEDVGLQAVMADIADQAILTGGAIMGSMVPAVINMATVVGRAVLRLAPWAAAGAIIVRTLQALGVQIDDVMPFINRLALAFQGVGQIVLGLVDGIAYFIAATIDRFMGMVNFVERSLGMMRDLQTAVEAGTMSAGEAATALSDYVGVAWRQEFDSLPDSVNAMLQSSEDRLTAGGSDLVTAVAGTGDEVADAMTPTLELAGVVREETEQVLQTFQGLTTGVDEGLLDVAGSTGELADETDRAVMSADALLARLQAIEQVRLSPALQGRVTQQQGGPGAPQRASDAAAFQAEAGAYWEGVRAAEQARVQAAEEAEARITASHASVAQTLADTAEDGILRFGDTLAQIRDEAYEAEGVYTRLLGAQVEARLAREAEVEAMDAARLANQDAAAAIWQQQAAADASREALARLGQSYDSIPTLAEAATEAQLDAIFKALGDYDPSLRTGSQYGERGRQVGGMSPEQIRAAQDDAIFGALGDYDPSMRTGSQYGERGSQTDAPSALDTALQNVTDSAGIFGDAILGAARDAVPALDAAITGFAQAGPLGALTGMLASLLQESEAFQGIMQAVNGILQPVIDALTTLLDALWPIIDVALALVETALAPLVGIIEGIVAPVFTAVARVVATIWNAIASAINWALGWLGVEMRTIDIDGTAPRPDTGDTGGSDGRTGGGLGNSGEMVGGSTRDRWGTVPPDVQFAVAAPLLEAAQAMASSTTALASVVSAMTGSDGALARFTGALDRATPVLDRIATDGITIRGGASGSSRPARLTALR